MTKESGQLKQFRSWVESLPIPPQQRADGKTMPKIVDTRRCDTGWQIQPKPGNQCMECLAYGAGVDRRPGKRESWLVRRQDSRVSLLGIDIPSQSRRHARTEGNKARLAEFCLADHEKLAAEVDIRPSQSCNLTDSQAKPVQDREDGRVGYAAQGPLVLVGQTTRHVNKPAGLREAEYVGNAPSGLAPRLQLQRRDPEDLLIDHPVE